MSETVDFGEYREAMLQLDEWQVRLDLAYKMQWSDTAKRISHNQVEYWRKRVEALRGNLREMPTKKPWWRL